MTNGYWCIRLDGVLYLAHRLAWLYMYGLWPPGQIDHISGERLDNRILNLRETTPSENNQNRRTAPKHSKSGVFGVSERGGKWTARISHEGICYRVSGFFSAEEAAKEYIRMKRLLHPACTI
jgi:hypothetical protein